MRAPSPREAELLIPLHEGMYEQPMWHIFLDRLRGTAGTDYATLIVRTPESREVISLFSGARAPPDLAKLFMEKFGHDPLPHLQMREGRVYALDELLELGGDVQRAFRNEMLAPLALDHLISVRVREPGGLDAWLGLVDRKGTGAKHAALLTTLAPHVRVAVRHFADLERERLRTSIAADVVSRMNFGWISIDDKCRILDIDPQADKILQRSGAIYRGRYDRLAFGSAKIDREMAMLAKSMRENPNSRARAINLSRDPWIDLLVAPTPARSMSASAQPVAIIYVSGDRRSNADRCEQLVDLFALTRSEARLAWALAQGQTIAEAATTLGLTTETARFYSKKIFAKTGARRQADLVRYILASVLALS
jgi:DNA-binding CsgD family transcriptional regulator